MKSLVFVFLATVAVNCIAECDYGWESSNEKCYKMFEEVMNWEDAEKECEKKTAHLVKIQSKAENQFLLDKFLQIAEEEVNIEAWIGLSDRDEENKFVWTDGTSPSYTNWADDQPNDEFEQDCAEIANGVFWPGGAPQIGVWNDFQCDRHIMFICEKPKA